MTMVWWGDGLIGQWSGGVMVWLHCLPVVTVGPCTSYCPLDVTSLRHYNSRIVTCMKATQE